MELNNAKGTTDFSGATMAKRKQLINMLESVFKLYSYEELDTPIIERYDVLTYKYGDDAPILNEIFKLKDQGDRDLCLRYDLTVPFSRFIGMNTTLKMPYKRFAVGKVYRDGPVKLGRTREFIQCDFDMVGSKKIDCEIEVLSILFRAFDKIGIDINIEINNVIFLKALIRYCGIPDQDIPKFVSIIDKVKKISKKQFETELVEQGFDKNKVDELIQKLNFKTNKEKFGFLTKILTDDENIKLNEFKLLLDAFGDKNLVFNLGLARGFNYYTGPVFEVYDNSKTISSSLAGGGRFDEMIGNYLDGKREFPAVGGSFGLEPIMVLIEKLDDQIVNENKLFIIPINNYIKSLEIAEQFRDSGINTGIDLTGRNVGKNMDYANSKKYEYVIVIGENELSSNKFKLKNMETGEEREVSIKQAIKILK